MEFYATARSFRRDFGEKNTTHGEMDLSASERNVVPKGSLQHVEKNAENRHIKKLCRTIGCIWSLGCARVRSGKQR
jgi:hypothetical protein